MLDWPTKVGIIVQKTDSTTLGYVVESLYTRMWRTGQKDPYASNGLGDIILEIIWAKNYVASILRKYPEVFNPCCNSDAETIRTAKSYIDSPLKFFLQTEGPDKDPTWLQALPNEALRLAMKHCIEVAQGFYKPEIAGALKQPKGERYNVEQFHKGSRVAKRFFEPFQIAYDSLVGSPKDRSKDKTENNATAAATADGATGIVEEVASEDKKKTEVTQIHVNAFREQCEQASQKEIEGRVVMIVAEGSAVEIHATVTKTRLYQNLTEAATVMGFYDVSMR